MIFNSIAIIRQYAEKEKLSLGSNFNGLKILEAFSASGLRSIRYAKEIVGNQLDPEASSSSQLVREIIANDLSKRAIQRIEFNVKANQVDQIVKVNHAGDLCKNH